MGTVFKDSTLWEKGNVMPATYDCIATTTLTTATASVTFSSISGNYTDLVLIIGGLASENTQVQFQFNGDTGSNYSSTTMYGDGSTAGSVRTVNQTQANVGGIAVTDPGTNVIHIMNYANSTSYKTVIGRYTTINTGSYYEAGYRAGLWRSNNAITSIKVMLPSTYTYSTDTVFSLYGIKEA